MADLYFVNRFSIDDNFIGRYEHLVKEVVIPYQEDALNDQLKVLKKPQHRKLQDGCPKIRTGKADGRVLRNGLSGPMLQNGLKVQHIL